MLEGSLREAKEAERSGRWDVALARYEAALTAATRDRDLAGLVDVLRWIGTVHLERGDHELAEEVYGASLAIAELNGFAPQVASAVIALAAAMHVRGELGAAEALYSRAGGIAESIGDERLLAMVEQNLGAIANIRGELAEALRRYHSSLRRFESLGDERTASRALHNMAMAYLDLADWEAASDCLERALGIAFRLQDSGTVGNIEISRAELDLKRARFDLAREHCDRAYEIFARQDSKSGLAEVYKHYGILYRETAKPLLADSHFSSAIEIARQGGDRLLEAEAMSEWARVHLEEERNREALQCLNDAHRIFTELSASRELLDLDRRLDGLESTYLEVVQAWGESIESKDRYTAGHCERVANYACMLAEAVGITGRDLTWLRMGGYLHDVGKIAVPPEILNKTGKLTDEEFRIIQGHAAAGDEIVSELNFPWDIRPAVRWHHERWDGSGYPDGLKGEEIPLTARILCVADVYDALTTTRSYRPAMSREEALEIMLRDVGRFFDPALFPIFRALISKESPMPDRRFPAFGSATVAAA